ncbi:MAG: hypothetical protein ABL994_03510 [Verrucomicrobiales bacterium]
MPSPDLTDLIRVLSGESVFDRDTDSKILQVSNHISARAMFELFKRCETSSPNWAQEFAEELMEIPREEHFGLISFEDGRWQDGESSGFRKGSPTDYVICMTDEEAVLEDSPDTSAEHFLRLQFTNAEACFYQFHLFPSFDEPFIQSVSRKRADDSQYLCIRVEHPEQLQIFIENLRRNPHFVKVHNSTLEEFVHAPSHAM